MTNYPSKQSLAVSFSKQFWKGLIKDCQLGRFMFLFSNKQFRVWYIWSLVTKHFHVPVRDSDEFSNRNDVGNALTLNFETVKWSNILKLSFLERKRRNSLALAPIVLQTCK